MSLDINIFNSVFLIFVIPLALLYEGMRRKLTARMQNRIGPPIWQPFYDILKLFKKGKSDSKAEENIFFKVIPVLYFLSIFATFLFIPFPVISFKYDFILFIYVVILSGAFYILSGFASSSPFGSLGSMRETILMLCYEIIFAISIVSFMDYADITSLISFDQEFMLFKLPLSSLSLLIIALIEMKITPFDTVEAQTEILGGIGTEFSGRGLAFLEISKDLKLLFFVLLTTTLLFGKNDIFLFWMMSLFILFIFTFCQVTTCRYRMDQTFKILVFVLLLVVIEFVRIKYIVW